MAEPTARSLIAAATSTARRLYSDDPAIEIADQTFIRADEHDGAWIQAWVWVPEEEIRRTADNMEGD